MTHPDDRDDYGPYNWHREAHAEAMLLGLGCPFDCCGPADMDQHTWEVVTPYGLLYAWSREDAVVQARQAAAQTGRAVTLRRTT